MPWQCECGADVEADNHPCPSCGTSKSAWTMAGNVTRHLVVSGPSFKCLRGTCGDEVAAGHASHDGTDVLDAEVAWVHAATDVEHIAAAGELPAAKHVVIARLFPGKTGSRQVKLEVLHDFQEAEVLGPFEPEDPTLDANGAVDVRFVFVAREGGEPCRTTFPGLNVIDISEQTHEDEWSFAPQVVVQALRKSKALPTRRVEEPAFFFSF